MTSPKRYAGSILHQNSTEFCIEINRILNVSQREDEMKDVYGFLMVSEGGTHVQKAFEHGLVGGDVTGTVCSRRNGSNQL
jgi:hypothetical protein